MSPVRPSNGKWNTAVSGLGGHLFVPRCKFRRRKPPPRPDFTVADLSSLPFRETEAAPDAVRCDLILAVCIDAERGQDLRDRGALVIVRQEGNYLGLLNGLVVPDIYCVP